MTNQGEFEKLMMKPLPEILADIQESIKLSNEAAKNAREAAIDIQKAGEKAVVEATKAINQKISEVEQLAKRSIQLAEQIKTSITNGMMTVNQSLSDDNKSPVEPTRIAKE